MTSKADRKRRKLAQRKAQPYLPQHVVDDAGNIQFIRPEAPKQPEKEDHHFTETELQKAAWSWFIRLAGDEAAAAKAQLNAIRAELTMEEFAVLAESARWNRPTHYRVGQSSTATQDRRMSALRKLVVYRSMNGLAEGTGALDGEQGLGPP